MHSKMQRGRAGGKFDTIELLQRQGHLIALGLPCENQRLFLEHHRLRLLPRRAQPSNHLHPSLCRRVDSKGQSSAVASFHSRALHDCTRRHDRGQQNVMCVWGYGVGGGVGGCSGWRTADTFSSPVPLGQAAHEPLRRLHCFVNSSRAHVLRRMRAGVC